MPRILVVKPSSFGDIIHGLQVVESIRCQLPDIHITWVVRDIFAPLVRSAETVDEILVYERKGGVQRLYQLLKKINSLSFDIVLDLQGLARSGLMTAAAKASIKLGRSDAREFAGLAYDHAVSLPESGRNSHAVEILLQFLPEFGLKAELAGAVRFTPGEVRSEIEEIAGKRPVLLFPDSRRAEKEWPYFEALTRKLLASDEPRMVVWAGSNAPATDLEDERFINLVGKTSLEEVLALVSGAKLVIANDSGPMHLAAAAGVPVLGIFGPTSPALYGPFPPNRPMNRTIVAPEGELARLTTDVVYEEVHDMLMRFSLT